MHFKQPEPNKRTDDSASPGWVARKSSPCHAASVSCHACQSANFVRLLSAHHGTLELRRCRGCHFVYLADWEQSLEQHRELYRYYEDLTADDRVDRYSATNRARQEVLLNGLAGYTQGRRLLDVGCGDGQLLETAKESPWDGRGIDLSEAAIAICVKQGLRASRLDFFDASLDAERFDAIVMSELLEHVQAPGRFLQRAEALLASGGILYLTTPNFGSAARRLLGGAWPVIHPEHIGYFERSTLQRLARRHTELREVRIEANNLSPSTLRAWLRRWTNNGPPTVDSDHAGERVRRTSLDQKLRQVIHQSQALTAAKTVANLALSATDLGDTLVAWFQKPAV